MRPKERAMMGEKVLSTAVMQGSKPSSLTRTILLLVEIQLTKYGEEIRRGVQECRGFSVAWRSLIKISSMSEHRAGFSGIQRRTPVFHIRSVYRCPKFAAYRARFIPKAGLRSLAPKTCKGYFPKRSSAFIERILSQYYIKSYIKSPALDYLRSHQIGQLAAVQRVASPGPFWSGLHPGSFARVPSVISLTTALILHWLAVVALIILNTGQAVKTPRVGK